MLSENIKILRKEKGMSQEELALKLNVVRQTVSKWEQNLSVPDSEMLIKLSEVFEVPVSRLLGERVEENNTKTELEKISNKLENLNSMIAERNNKSRRTWLVIIAVCLVITSVILIVFSVLFLIQLIYAVSPASSVAIIGGADGSTAIFVASTVSWLEMLVLFAVGMAVLIAAIFIFRRIKKQ